MPSHRRTTRLLPGATSLLLLVCACNAFGGADGAPPPPPASSPASSTDPGGGVSGNPGNGNASDPAGAGGAATAPTLVEPGGGRTTLVVPRPGQQHPHPIAPTLLQASVDGRHVLVKVSWYGGVEPCSVLDSVGVERGPGTVALTVLEGSSDLTAICPEIAMLKATIVDLGELAPGRWTVSAPGSDAARLQLTIQ